MTLPSSQEASRALYGTIRLARLDRTGAEFFGSTPEAALRSFYVAALVAPAHLVLMLLRLVDVVEEINYLRYFAVETIAYVISWTAFPLLLWHLGPLLDRREQVFRAIAAQNWSAVLQIAVLLAVSGLGAAAFVPEALVAGLAIAISFALLCYQWFILRSALDIGGLPAFGLLIGGVLIEVMVRQAADGLVFGM
ncbi:hypothetical protein [Arenibaculum pallidiluteum]|uniref:hypothetical protein n=1 Tax=Arenibaculum pallidiluteum TaxID=2812559 RepID=UPI001A97B5CE|nr:hypothetical protein [Arenibaculum pallidiluteum]